MPKILRSESFGTRAAKGRPSTKVRVYERADASGRFWLERAWVTTERGHPIPRALKDGTSWEAAQIIAEETALARRKKLLQGVDELGRRVVTVEDLLDGYHSPRNPRVRKWSVKHHQNQERYRRFWLRALGAESPAEDIAPAEIEGVAAQASDRLGWSPDTEAKYLKYLKAASRWGHRKGQMFRLDPWSAVDLPDVVRDTKDLIYTKAHAALLARPHDAVDWRVTVVASIAYDTGRRLSAIRHLWRGTDPDPYAEGSDFMVLEVEVEVEVDGVVERIERMFLHFRPEFDKGDRDQWVPVSDETRAIIEEALEKPEVVESGWLVPEGRLGYDDPRDKPMGAGSLIDALHASEDELGVPRVRGRAYHGLKRTHVTEGDRIAQGNLSLVGDVTGNRSIEVLKTRYRFAQAGQMVLQVDAVRAELPPSKGAESGHENGHSTEELGHDG